VDVFAHFYGSSTRAVTVPLYPFPACFGRFLAKKTAVSVFHGFCFSIKKCLSHYTSRSLKITLRRTMLSICCMHQCFPSAYTRWTTLLSNIVGADKYALIIVITAIQVTSGHNCKSCLLSRLKKPFIWCQKTVVSVSKTTTAQSSTLLVAYGNSWYTRPVKTHMHSLT